MNLKPYIIDDAPRFWTFLTVRFNATAVIFSAGFAGAWLAIGEDGRKIVINYALGWLSLPADLLPVVAAGITGFMGAATIALRGYKQQRADAPPTEPGVRVVDDLSAPTQPMGRRK